MQERKKILIIYKHLDYPLRTTIDEHLYAFKKYSNSYCYYLGLDTIDSIPEYLLKIDFDLVVFHYGFVGARWAGKENLKKAIDQVGAIFNTRAVKAIMPQDEHKGSYNLAWMVNTYNIDCVFSVSPESEWEKLYPTVDFNKVRFYKMLTGYLDDEAIKKINKLSAGIKKDIDIGYRARNLPPMLGRHGYLKGKIADIFNARVSKYGFKTNISTKEGDTILGDDWYRFLLRCKYFIGVEGGSTVHDPEGKIWAKGIKFLKEHPQATFEEVEAFCFPELDGKLQLIAISPRHLETCATRTCQVLVESSYNGILIPNVHYIELKKDMSNLDEVLQVIKDDKIREAMVERAYNDIVLSGKYSYREAVKSLIMNALGVDVSSKEYLDIPYIDNDSLQLNKTLDDQHWQITADLYKKKRRRYLRQHLKGEIILGSIIILKMLGVKVIYNLIRKKKPAN